MLLVPPRVGNALGVEPQFRASLIAAQALLDQGWSRYPAITPPTVSGGLDLNGTDQYTALSGLANAGIYAGGTASQLSLVVEFYPDFAANEDVQRRIFDTTAGDRYSILRENLAASSALVITLGNTIVATIPYAVWSPFWVQGGRNQLVIAGTSGNTDIYLNEEMIACGVSTTWTRTTPGLLYLGASSGATQFWSGRITNFEIWNRKFTGAEVNGLWGDQAVVANYPFTRVGSLLVSDRLGWEVDSLGTPLFDWSARDLATAFVGGAMTVSGTPDYTLKTPWIGSSDDLDRLAAAITTASRLSTTGHVTTPLITDDIVMMCLCSQMSNAVSIPALCFDPGTNLGFYFLNNGNFAFRVDDTTGGRTSNVLTFTPGWVLLTGVFDRTANDVRVWANAVAGAATGGVALGGFGASSLHGYVGYSVMADAHIHRVLAWSGAAIGARVTQTFMERLMRSVAGFRTIQGPLATFTRSSLASHRTSSKWFVMSSGMARSGGDQGLVLEPVACVNKVVNNINPTVTTGWAVTAGLSVVVASDSARLAAAGVDATIWGPNVFVITNPTGATGYFYSTIGSTGGLTPHSLACLALTISGAVPGLYDPGTGDWTSSLHYLDADYTLTQVERITPVTADQRFGIQIPAGATVCVVGQHLQSGPALSPHAPVPCQSVVAPQTAAAETLSLGGPTLTIPRRLKYQHKTWRNNPRRIWITAGQSNGRGTSDPAYLPAGYWLTDPAIPCYIVSPDAPYTSPAVEALTTDGNWYSPGLALVKALKDSGQNVALVQIGQTTTSLAVDWNPALVGGLWSQMVAAARIMLAGAASIAPCTSGLAYRGLLWIQGENDASDATMAAAYEANLTNFIAATRGALPGLRDIFVVQLSSKSGWTFKNTVRAAQQAVAAGDPDVYLIDVDDLPLWQDNMHYPDGTEQAIGAMVAAQVEGLEW